MTSVFASISSKESQFESVMFRFKKYAANLLM